MIKKSKPRITISLYVFCFIIILIGVLLVVITSVQIENAFWTWDNLIKNVLSVIGTTLISAGLVSVFLEISDIKASISQAINRILNGDFSFKGYHKDALIDANKKIALCRLCLPENSSDLDDSIYKYYEPLILNAVESIYYKYHKAVFKITPSSHSGLFKVEVDCNYEIINLYNLKNTMQFKMKSYSVNNASNFELKTMTVNDESVTPDIKSETTSDNSIYYDTKIRIDYDFGSNQSTKVYMKYIYYSPIYDIRQSYKVTYPCQQLEHKIYMMPDENKQSSDWKVEASAFCPFYINQKQIDSKIRVEQNVEDSLKIKMDAWLPPGSGYVTVYIKK